MAGKIDAVRTFLSSRKSPTNLHGMAEPALADFYDEFLAYVKKYRKAKCSFDEFLDCLIDVTKPYNELVKITLHKHWSADSEEQSSFYLIESTGMAGLEVGEWRWLIPGVMSAEVVRGTDNVDVITNNQKNGFFVENTDLAWRTARSIYRDFKNSPFVTYIEDFFIFLDSVPGYANASKCDIKYNSDETDGLLVPRDDA